MMESQMRLVIYNNIYFSTNEQTQYVSTCKFLKHWQFLFFFAKKYKKIDVKVRQNIMLKKSEKWAFSIQKSLQNIVNSEEGVGGSVSLTDDPLMALSKPTYIIFFWWQEREKYGQEVTKWQKELQELQSQVVEENSAKLRLQMELDSKDSEIEQLLGRLATLGSETASLSSADNDNDEIYSQG